MSPVLGNRLSDHGEKIVLRISCDKTKTMSSEQQLHLPLNVGQQDVEHVQHSQYLGSYISKDGGATADDGKDWQSRIGFPKTTYG